MTTLIQFIIGGISFAITVIALCFLTKQSIVFVIQPFRFEILGLYVNHTASSGLRILFGLCFCEGWRTGLLANNGHVYIESVFSLNLPDHPA